MRDAEKQRARENKGESGRIRERKRQETGQERERDRERERERQKNKASGAQRKDRSERHRVCTPTLSILHTQRNKQILQSHPSTRSNIKQTSHKFILNHKASFGTTT